MYFIITDKDDMHCGHKFTTGMNEIQTYYYINRSLDAISELNSNNKHVIISKIYIRFVCLDHSSILDPSSMLNNYKNMCIINSGKIFVSDKYFIFCPKTIKKFNIKITNGLVSMACANNYIDFLDWYESEYNLDASSACDSESEDYYDSLPIDVSSAFGNKDVLEWWFKSKLPLKYSHRSLNSASANGHINVLTWWFKSGLPLKYNEYALTYASYNGHIGVLEWWFNSGLELKYTETALDWTSCHGHINVLEWWLKSGLPLKYTRLAVKIPDMYKKMDVVAWWKDSGLPLAFESINHTITKIPSKTTSKKKKTSFIKKIFSVFSKNKN
jgi:hypothetical protein